MSTPCSDETVMECQPQTIANRLFSILEIMWQTLAPEIVTEILLQFLPAPKISLTEPQQFPWHLGHVCRMWRGVFLSHLQFWTTFVVDITDTYQLGDLERALTILKTRLIDRGGDHPISFKLRLGDSYCPSYSQTPEALCCGQMPHTATTILPIYSAGWMVRSRACSVRGLFSGRAAIDTRLS